MSSSAGYGAMTGICCAVVLEIDESEDSWLAVVDRLAFGFDGSESYLLGDARPVTTEEDRGGRLGPFSPSSVLSPRAGSLVLCERCCCASSMSPLLPMLPCRVPPLRVPSRPVLCRNRCCFFFRPCRRLMMMSRMRGRKLSRLACEASWLSVSSSMPRSSSGTFPRSPVSTPMALNARDAMLNS